MQYPLPTNIIIDTIQNHTSRQYVAPPPEVDVALGIAVVNLNEGIHNETFTQAPLRSSGYDNHFNHI
ncbi:unnamed protein product [Hermetia illucens]|uniref:Uncharacterized protein n=1 Tax=Hermetia illucens TaxID=343691 RepID=A0A7R8UXL0_HERIL|nr:unnamed protein product [Hermetia illucens]